MSKLSLFFLIATFAYCTAFSSFWDSSEEIDDNSWFKMPKMHFKPFTMPEFKPINPAEIKDLKPDGPNSHVQGSSSSQSMSTSYVNGKLVKHEQKADVYLNDNGKTKEYHVSN